MQHDQTSTTRAANAWRLVIGIILLITAARIGFALLLSPYTLTGDEAHYWEWSRRPALSYTTKGPAIAWTIAASTRVFGHTEWAVRLPAALFAGVLLAAVSGLARACAQPTARRTALWGLAACLLVTPYNAVALLMTIDGPYIACWAVSALLGWLLLRRWMTGSAGIGIACALGAVLGIGFLFKYTIVLLVPGLLGGWHFARRGITAQRFPAAMAAAAVVFGVTISPVLIWNALHGWPTVTHLLGHLGAPGGESMQGDPWSPWNPLLLIGTQVGMLGPAAALFVIAILRTRPGRSASDDVLPHARTYLLWCAAPILLFYVAVSFVIEAEGNWPIAGYVTLAALAGAIAGPELSRWRVRVRSWRAAPDRPKRGFFRRKPETPFQVAWHWSVGFAAVAAVGMCMLPALAGLPVVGSLIPLHRMTGARQEIEPVREVLAALASDPAAAGEPMIVASRYNRASQLAFYLPGNPVVHCASSWLGDRSSPYDDFADTDLADPSLAGRPAVLVGAGPQRWAETFGFDRIDADRAPADPDGIGRVHVGYSWRGPLDQPEAAHP